MWREFRPTRVLNRTKTFRRTKICFNFRGCALLQTEDAQGMVSIVNLDANHSQFRVRREVAQVVVLVSASAICIQGPGIDTSTSDSDAFSRNNIGRQGAHFVAPCSIRASFVNVLLY